MTRKGTFVFVILFLGAALYGPTGHKDGGIRLLFELTMVPGAS